MKSTLLTFVALFVSSPLLAQELLPRTGADVRSDSRPTAISGMASGARHCVAGDGANVHGVGWVDTGTVYTVTFESDSTLVTGMTRLDLDGDRANSSFGSPELRFTSSTPGTMALYVGASGEGGCYRYRVDLLTSAIATAPASAVGRTTVSKSSNSASPLAISGLASSAKHCVAGIYVSNVHDLGRVEQGTQVTVTFASDFDPIAGVTLVNLVTQQTSYFTNDDADNSLQPRLEFTASHSSTLALFVAGYNGSAGCYRYKVDIR